MNEGHVAIAHALHEEAGRSYDPDEQPWSESAPLMHKAAVDWAEHSLKTYSGDVLRAAIAVSVAIAEFTQALDMTKGKQP